MIRRPRVLLVTDLAYPARGRRYGEEDVALASALREHLDLALCHPRDAQALMDGFDVVLVRNSGPVLHYQEAYDAFVAHARAIGARVFPELSGKADQRGKQYLVDLYAAGYPVIPTVTGRGQAARLPRSERYVVKPIAGADSLGLREVAPQELATLDVDGLLVQPRVEIRHEISFYFVDRELHYALRTPDPARRWDLAAYPPTAQDRAFAQRFVDWNDIEHGIQRVDAARTADGRLLLVELEDLNPYLSLDVVAPQVRARFLAAVVDSLRRLAGRPAPAGAASRVGA